MLLAVLLAGCVPQAMLAQEHQALVGQMEQARAAQRCAPRELALAESHLAFAQLEFEQGDTHRATEHLAVVRTNLAVALACAPKPAAPAAPATPVAAPVLVDTDGDAVADPYDACPTVPEDLDGFQDVDGCPEIDNDGDGILDAADACRDVPEDKNGYLDTDGCPDGTGDRDADGVPDAQDACPDQVGAAVDRGCPPADADRDGVLDRADACPGELETRNGYLDEDGCPDSPPARVEVTATQIVIKERVEFATGKATLLASSFPVLDDVAKVLKDYPAIRVEIAGHTDNVGDDLANQRLSKARADAVYEYLLGKGVQGSRMFAVGYGETRPIDSNATEPGRQVNRRVEFLIVAQ